MVYTQLGSINQDATMHRCQRAPSMEEESSWKQVRGKELDIVFSLMMKLKKITIDGKLILRRRMEMLVGFEGSNTISRKNSFLFILLFLSLGNYMKWYWFYLMRCYFEYWFTGVLLFCIRNASNKYLPSMHVCYSFQMIMYWFYLVCMFRKWLSL